MIPSNAPSYSAAPATRWKSSRAGEIPGLKIGRNWLFVRGDLLVYLAERAREEALQRRMKRQPHAPLPMAKPRRQTPPVLPSSPKPHE